MATNTDTKYRINVHHDEDGWSTYEPQLGRVVSFNSSHRDFEHPDTFLDAECATCDGTGLASVSKDYNTPNVECETCEGTGDAAYESFMDNPDVLTVLSYYEHGMCTWMVGASTVPDHGGFDTVNVAGLIVWNGGDDEREWWFDELSDADRARMLKGIAEEYTDVCNGNVYGYVLEEGSGCETCGTMQWVELDSCSGFIGNEWFLDAVRDTIAVHDIDPAAVTVGGDFGYIIEGCNLALQTPMADANSGATS